MTHPLINLSSSTISRPIYFISLVLLLVGQITCKQAGKVPPIDVARETNIFGVYHALAQTRKTKEDLVVLFYSPLCHHCEQFIGKYNQAAKDLQKKGIKFLKLNCGKNQNAIPAFNVNVFPDVMFFHNGLPRARMPLTLTGVEGLTEQWFKMMKLKYDKNGKTVSKNKSTIVTKKKKITAKKSKAQVKVSKTDIKVPKPKAQGQVHKKKAKIIPSSILNIATTNLDKFTEDIIDSYHLNLKKLLFSPHKLVKKKDAISTPSKGIVKLKAKNLILSPSVKSKKNKKTKLTKVQDLYEPTEHLSKLKSSGV